MNYGRSAAFRNWAIPPTTAPQTAPSPQIAELDVVDEATSTWHRVQLPLPCPQNITELRQEVMRLVDPTGVTTPDTHHLVVADAAMRVVGPFTSVEQVGLGYLLKLFRLQKPPPPRSDVATTPKSLPQFEPGCDYGPTSYSTRPDDHHSTQRGHSSPQLQRWYSAEEKEQEEHAKDERPLLPDPVRKISAKAINDNDSSHGSLSEITHHEDNTTATINKMVEVVVNNFHSLRDPTEPNASISYVRLQSILQSEHDELYEEVINGLFNRKFHKFVAEKTHLFVFNYTDYEIEAVNTTLFDPLRIPPYVCANALRVSTSSRPVVLEADRKQSARYERFLMESLDRHSLDTSPTSFWKMLSGVQQRKIQKCVEPHLAAQQRTTTTTTTTHTQEH